jgi:hypothetical protein
MSLETVAKHLENMRVGRVGVSIFVNEMPESCSLGVLVRDRYSGTPIDHYLPNYRQTGYRLAIRSTTYKEGFDFAWRVVEALTLHAETQVGDTLVKQFLPQNEPRPYRRSAGAFWEFEVDLDAVFISPRR